MECIESIHGADRARSPGKSDYIIVPSADSVFRTRVRTPLGRRSHPPADESVEIARTLNAKLHFLI